MVDIVCAFRTDVNLNEVLHCLDYVVLCESKVFYRIFIFKFLVELVASYATEVITADAEEHCCKVAFCSLDGDWFTRHENLIYLGKTFFFCWLVRIC